MKGIKKRAWLILGVILLIGVILALLAPWSKKEKETKPTGNQEQVQEDFFQNSEEETKDVVPEETDTPTSNDMQKEEVVPTQKPEDVQQDMSNPNAEENQNSGEEENELVQPPKEESIDEEEWSGFY